MKYSFPKPRLCVGHPWHNAKSQLFCVLKMEIKEGKLSTKEFIKTIVCIK